MASLSEWDNSMIGNGHAEESIEYRVVFVDPVARQLCVPEPIGRTRRLPRVRIPVHTRLTPRMHSEIGNIWGIQGTIVDFLSLGQTEVPCAVVELLSERSVDKCSIVRLDNISDEDLSDDERASIRSLITGDVLNPLSRLGWVREAAAWVERVTGETFGSLEMVEQLNAGSGFALLRFRTSNGRGYWLKATGEPNAHERRITSFLSELYSESVPRVLAVNAEWNAWLTREPHLLYGELPTDAKQRFRVLEAATIAMARLQRAAVGHEADLFRAGAFDQRLKILRLDSELLFERIAEAMALQTSTKVAPIEKPALDRLRDVFEVACDYLDTLSIPAAVVHGDINVGNILYGNDGCFFIDWCETYVGHPLVALQHLLLLNQPADAHLKAVWDRVLIDRYCAIFQDVCGTGALTAALRFAPLIASASAIYGRGDWLCRPWEENRHRLSWVRTLARYMQRAASDPTLLDVVVRERAVYAD